MVKYTSGTVKYKSRLCGYVFVSMVDTYNIDVRHSQLICVGPLNKIMHSTESAPILIGGQQLLLGI